MDSRNKTEASHSNFGWRQRLDRFRQAHPRPDASPWRSRGYLPHFDAEQVIQGITIRLFDSLPAGVVRRWQDELAAQPEKVRTIELQRCIAAYLDAAHGSCWLGQPEIARLVEDALLFFDAERYRMLAWCVMPNHVHVVIETLPDQPLDGILKSWKGFTAREANKILGRRGTFWEREYHDRMVRDGRHLDSLVRYVEENPVAAGLAQRPEDWSFGSARFPRRLPSLPLQ